MYRRMLLALLFVSCALAQNSLGGCTIFPANNIWNIPANNLPVHPNSAAYVSTVGATSHLFPDFWSDTGGIPYTLVPAGQPMVPVAFYYAAESDPGPYPIPANANIEPGSDRHILLIDQGACKLYEIFSAEQRSDGTWSAGSGAVYDLKSDILRPNSWTSADAAGLPILPGLVRYDEVMTGHIDHAIRMTAPYTANSYVWPARHFASALSGSQYPPMGLRFRLKASFDVTPYPYVVQVILNALKKYGAILADNGAPWFLSGVADPRWVDDDLHTITSVMATNMEAVDSSSLMVEANSAGIAAPLRLEGIYLDQRDVTKGTTVNGEVILSSPAPAGGIAIPMTSSNSAAVTAPPSVVIAGGAVSASFTVTVKSVAQSTNVTLFGVYNGVTVTSPALLVDADPSAVTPPSSGGGTPAPAGSIHINAAGPAYTDPLGNVWAADSGFTGGAIYFTGNAIANTTTPTLYQTCRYGNFSYGFAVPNGTYKVTLKFAEASRLAVGLRQFNVAINGAAVLTNFDIYALAGKFTAIDQTFPVSVTGGQITIQFTQGAADLPIVNAIDIEPTGTTSTPTPTPTPTPSSALAVNAGGPAYTDTSGSVWVADSGFSGGAVYSTGNAIANTTTPALYQTCRYGNFSYGFSVPNGSYSVTLKFAEPSRLGVGLRQFNVAINGAAVLTNFDIYARAGGGFIALDQTFPVTVTGGQIAIQFSSGAADLPLVNAIVLVATSPGNSGLPSVRLNAGGTPYTDPFGHAWAGDFGYTGGYGFASSSSIGNTTTPTLYQTCRYGNFSYALSVPNGTYKVTLKFAEPSRLGVGLRQFNVAINGATVLTNFDIFAQTGGLTAIDETFPVTVTGGQILIQFSTGSADLPLVNAIDIEPGS